jgi:hypothetical protein
MEETKMLDEYIKKLKKEIQENPHYDKNIVASILDDIKYYQNHLDQIHDSTAEVEDG